MPSSLCRSTMSRWLRAVVVGHARRSMDGKHCCRVLASRVTSTMQSGYIRINGKMAGDVHRCRSGTPPDAWPDPAHVATLSVASSRFDTPAQGDAYARISASTRSFASKVGLERVSANRRRAWPQSGAKRLNAVRPASSRSPASAPFPLRSPASAPAPRRRVRQSSAAARPFARPTAHACSTRAPCPPACSAGPVAGAC